MITATAGILGFLASGPIILAAIWAKTRIEDRALTRHHRRIVDMLRHPSRREPMRAVCPRCLETVYEGRILPVADLQALGAAHQLACRTSPLESSGSWDEMRRRVE